MSGLINENNNKEIKELKKETNFEARQNAVGFFSVLLKVAKRNPELWKQICNENNEDNRNTNNPN